MVGIEHELEFVIGLVEGAVPDVVEPFLHDVHKVGLWAPADDDALGEIARIRVTLGAGDDLDEVILGYPEDRRYVVPIAEISVHHDVPDSSDVDGHLYRRPVPVCPLVGRTRSKGGENEAQYGSYDDNLLHCCFSFHQSDDYCYCVDFWLISEMLAFPLNTSFQRTIRSASESKWELVILRETIRLNMGKIAQKSKENFQHVDAQPRDRPDG